MEIWSTVEGSRKARPDKPPVLDPPRKGFEQGKEDEAADAINGPASLYLPSSCELGADKLYIREEKPSAGPFTHQPPAAVEEGAHILGSFPRATNPPEPNRN